MDDNTKEVLILLITTISTLGIGWLKIKSLDRHNTPPPAAPPPSPPPSPPVDPLT